MADPRFFQSAGPFTLAQLADVSGAELRPEGAGDQQVKDVAPLDSAGPDDVSFLDNKQYLDSFAVSKAGACIVEPRYAERAPEGMALLLSATPYMAYAKVAQAFYPPPALVPVPHSAVPRFRPPPC